MKTTLIVRRAGTRAAASVAFATLAIASILPLAFGQSLNPAATPAAKTSEPKPTDPTGPTRPDGAKEDATVNLDRMVVSDKRPEPFSDANVDLPRTINDAQPYYIFDAGAIDRIDATSMQDFFKRNVTMDTTSKTAMQGSSRLADGSSNLRGLGTGQTLILINGRRSANVSYQGSEIQADINSIPLAAVERVEVLPSSASGLYGGNAVGGAINIILKDNYAGGEIKFSYDRPMDIHIPLQNVEVTYGFPLEGGKTQVMLSGAYSNASGLLMRDRVNLLNDGIARMVQNDPSSYYTTAKPPWGSTPNIASANGSNLTLKNGTSLNSPITFLPAGFSATSNPNALVANAGRFNVELPNGVSQHFGLQANLIDSSRVKSLLTTVRRDMTDRLRIFASFWVHSNFSNPTNGPVFNTFAVPASAPTNPFNQTVNIAFPVNLPSDLPIRTTGRRATAGFVLKLPAEWKAEGDYSWESTNFVYLFRWSDASSGSVGPIQSAIANGTLNPFVDTLLYPLTPIQAYLANDSYYANSTMGDLGLRLSGPLGRLPGGPTTFTLGLEHRHDGDGDAHQYFVVNGFPADNTDQLYYGHAETIDSAYIEAHLPLISTANQRPGVRLLDLQLAGRTERYSVGEGTTTNYVVAPASLLATNTPLFHGKANYQSTNPTMGLRYKPVDAMTVRASYAMAFLAPTYSQLAANPFPAASLTTVNDPQRGNTPQDVQTIGGGNRSLQPQKAKNWNLGVIFEPSMIPGLRADVEWYHIRESNVISTLSAQNIVTNASLFPDRVVRAPVPAGDKYPVGPITLVDASVMNLTNLETEGFDVSLSYRKEAHGYGVFGVSARGTVIEHYKTQSTLNAPLVDVVNQVNGTGPLKYKGNATLTWGRGHVQAGWTTEYYGWYLQSSTFVKAQGSDRVPRQIYHNIFVSYDFGPVSHGASTRAERSWFADTLAGTSIKFGVKNVFNTLPPYDPAYAQHYFSPFADARLRDWNLSVTKSF